MNLLMISGDRTLASGRSGAFWYTLKELRKHWERIDVLCPRAQNNFQFSSLRQGYGRQAIFNFQLFDNVFLHPSPHSLWYQPLWILRKGRELVRQYHYDVMTVHEYPPFYNGLGAFLLYRALHIPYVLEVHHVGGYPHAASVREFLERILCTLFLRIDVLGACGIRCVNTSVRDVLLRWGIPSLKLHVVPSVYLDQSLIRSVPKMEKNVDIVCCGRLVRPKAFDLLLRAVARLPGTTLRVIGEGPERGGLEKLARSLGIADRVVFGGWCHELADVYRFLVQGKVFVMCSRSEGNPRVLVEAMALELPVIATRVGIVPDMLREGMNGVFTNGTAEDLAAKIQHLLSDAPLRERMGKAASESVGQFSMGAAIATYADFLKSFV